MEASWPHCPVAVLGCETSMQLCRDPVATSPLTVGCSLLCRLGMAIKPSFKGCTIPAPPTAAGHPGSLAQPAALSRVPHYSQPDHTPGRQAPGKPACSLQSLTLGSKARQHLVEAERRQVPAGTWAGQEA